MSCPGPVWCAAELETARNLYEQGVQASDIVDTLNQLYRRGRTKAALRQRMHMLKVVWACRIGEVDGADVARALACQARGRMGAARRVESLAAAERTQPWHPAHDRKPEWLRRA